MDSEKSTPAPTHPEIPPTDDRVRHRVDSTGQVFAVFSGGLFINVSTGETGRLAPEDLAAMKRLPRQAEYPLGKTGVRAVDRVIASEGGRYTPDGADSWNQPRRVIRPE